MLQRGKRAKLLFNLLKQLTIVWNPKEKHTDKVIKNNEWDSAFKAQGVSNTNERLETKGEKSKSKNTSKHKIKHAWKHKYLRFYK